MIMMIMLHQLQIKIFQQVIFYFSIANATFFNFFFRNQRYGQINATNEDYSDAPYAEDFLLTFENLKIFKIF